MTYYILMDMDTIDDIWDDNILGEESFGTFYAGSGYKAFKHMIIKEPEALEFISIVDERKNPYTVEEFLDLISQWQIKS
jgi:hypothetical protein